VYDVGKTLPALSHKRSYQVCSGLKRQEALRSIHLKMRTLGHPPKKSEKDRRQSPESSAVFFACSQRVPYSLAESQLRSGDPQGQLMTAGDNKDNQEKDAHIQYVARNRKARHDYEILESFEAGISLWGSEVKSLRLGKVNISDAHATVVNGQVTLRNLHISPYEMATVNAHEPMRLRRLLLHKREIRKLTKATEERGLTLVPLAVYFKNGKVKIELAVARGRKRYDKREALAKRESERDLRRATKSDH
jgi:SsrA-binding protein